MNATASKLEQSKAIPSGAWCQEATRDKVMIVHQTVQLHRHEGAEAHLDLMRPGSGAIGRQPIAQKQYMTMSFQQGERAGSHANRQR
ncbi:hypothetical protein AOQ73_24050 [Bradyrhizobium pachyrhizi]|nr:hypothetical protein AOQ73_24050 [Bradyrhizobium pachyrhizi]